MMIINYILSSFFGFHFLLTLVIFHPLQVIAYNLFGARAHRKVVDVMNFILLYGSYYLGASIRSRRKYDIPTDKKIIFIANHQSMYDIIGLIWFFKEFNPTFVSKEALASGIPSISYNLRKSHAALINRKDKTQAIQEISRLGHYINDNPGHSVVIFPEGTRSRKGLKKFSLGGVTALSEIIEDACIVPVAIDGTGRMDAYKVFPLQAFQKLRWVSLKPINLNEHNIEEAMAMAKASIREEIGA